MMKLIYFAKAILLLTLAIGAGTAAAEVPTKGSASVTGRVIDRMNSQPISYAVVSLGILPDTTVKKSMLTDDKGCYSFSNVETGRYVVTANIVGYKPTHSSAITCNKATTKVEDITLENLVLKEITVVGKRPEIEQKADRTVLNVDNSATASAENAYEVLRKAPGVNIDKDDNISLKGKDGIMVTINDKPTYLSGQELASYLKSLQGSEIEKVELITTPPARYEAAGNTGIINIKIKKNNKIGVNGTANAGLTITNKVGGNAGLSLNMRKGKLNTFGSLNGRKGYGKNTILIDRKMNADTARTIQNSMGHGDVDGYNYRVGMDYEVNKRHTIGVLARGSKYDDTDKMNTRTDLLLRNGDLAKYLNTHNVETSTSTNLSLNANYKMSIDTNGRALNVDVDYVEYENNGNQDAKTYYFKPNGDTFSPSKLLMNQTPSNIYIKSFRIDYTHPFSKEMILETGIKGSTISSDNDLQYSKYNHASASYLVDNEQSNHFKYDEDILAAYASLAYEKNGWSLKGGLRAEQTNSKGQSITINQSTNKKYLDLFPTFFAQKAINESNSVGLSYTRRIDRPNYKKLNPFIFRVDEYAFQEGNPYLKPQYTDNIEVNHAWKNTIFTSLGYSYTKDVQMQVAEIIEISKPTNGNAQPTTATKIVERNLKGLSSITLNVSANLSPVKWFRTNNNVTAMYNEYSRDNGQSGNSKLMYLLYSSNSFLLPKQYTFEVMVKYNSDMAYGLINVEPMYCLNLGLQKKFFNNKLNAKVSFDDVFNTFNNRATAKYDNMDLFSKSTWSSQRIGISLTYRFGSSDVKQARQRSTSSDDEQSRTGK